MEQEKLKKYTLAVFGSAAVLVAFSVWNYSDAYSKSIQPSSFRSFSVSAEGKSVSIPDIASFTFSLVTQGDKNLAKIQGENTDKMNKAIAFVKANGIADKDIKTESYSVQPRYQYSTCPPNGGVCPPAEIVGYEINQSVLVKIRDFAKIGDILAGVVNNGANSVSGFQFTLDNPTSAQDLARAEAIQKAKVKAEAIAKAGGFSLGRLLGISEGSNYPQPMYAYSTKAMAGADSASSPTVEAGSQETTVNVSLQYEIQ
ncbi:MAG: SIMPL domain-containing protein [Candidatus Jorgensenbacteria bacterium]|nr:SIMPL domain-containing protein [Candidatus Jorgensenbacteria bacterium]